MKIERILPEPLESFPYQTASAGGGIAQAPYLSGSLSVKHSAGSQA